MCFVLNPKNLRLTVTDSSITDKQFETTLRRWGDVKISRWDYLFGLGECLGDCPCVSLFVCVLCV